MTAVVGLVEGKRVILGSDSCVSYGELAFVHDGPKWKIFGDDYIVAYAGNIVAFHALEASVLPIEPGNSSPAAKIGKSILDPLREELKRIDDDSDPDLLIVLPHGNRTRLWRVHNWAVIPAGSGMAGIGSGGAVALAALEHATGSGSERVKKALKSASDHVLNVRPPYYVRSF